MVDNTILPGELDQFLLYWAPGTAIEIIDGIYLEVKMSQMSASNITGREPGGSILLGQGNIQSSAIVDSRMTISKIGLVSAVITSLCSAGYGIAVIALLAYSLSIRSSSPAQGWTGIDAFLATFQPIQMLPVIPSLLLAPAFTALMVSIHSFVSEDKRIWSRLGLAFTLIYATMAAMNYMVQLLPA